MASKSGFGFMTTKKPMKMVIKEELYYTRKTESRVI